MPTHAAGHSPSFGMIAAGADEGEAEGLADGTGVGTLEGEGLGEGAALGSGDGEGALDGCGEGDETGDALAEGDGLGGSGILMSPHLVEIVVPARTKAHRSLPVTSRLPTRADCRPT
ncbi:MAG TPA: hypothetical protein VIV12_07780 [Streptosporangiaceae bacterium]